VIYFSIELTDRCVADTRWSPPTEGHLHDPYQIFRTVHEIHNQVWETGAPADVAYMVDQSHNLKGKMEAMIQTVCTALELYAKAATVDHALMAPLQQSCSLMEAEETLRGAFCYDARPAIREWRRSHGLPEDPMQAFRESGYLERITAERTEGNAVSVTTYA
jgi:L-rhamnose isomerase/sugar isomerase